MTYEEILAYLESLKGTPVDLQAQMQGNPNEVNPVARGGTDVAWGNVPGLEQFYNYDIPSNQSTFNLSAALPEIQRLGYQVMQAEDPGAETMASWVAGPDGKPIAQSAHLTGTNDERFKMRPALAAGWRGRGANWALAGRVAAGGQSWAAVAQLADWHDGSAGAEQRGGIERRGRAERAAGAGGGH
ncbi:MAG: hypothetical protein IPI51_07570 [Betaproteobacteria bacterium]|nr:hypothetical protein [Betaproteobacteria bacterium]